MNPRKQVKELEKELRRDPGSLAVRVRLGTALVAVGRVAEAADLYRAVAQVYAAQGRLEQASAVCESLLEIAPDHPEARALLAELERTLAQRGTSAAADESAMTHRRMKRPSGIDLDLGAPVEADSKVPPAPGEASSPRRGFPLPSIRTIEGPPPVPGTPSFSPSEPSAHEFLPTQIGPRAGQHEMPPKPTPAPSPMATIRVAGRVQPPRSRSVSSAPPPLVSPGTEAPARSGRPTARPTVRPGLARPAPPPLPSAGATPPPPSGPRPPPLVPRPHSEVDEDTPTRIADRWAEPSSPPPRPPARAIPPPARAATPTPSVTLPRARPVSAGDFGDDGDGSGEHTIIDEGLELGRMLGQPAVASGAGDDRKLELPMLKGLPERVVAEIATGMRHRLVASGELVVREGEAGDSCFVLARGELRVLKRDPINPRGDLIEVSRLGDGAFFGEVALLTDRRRHATVQAVAESELYELPRELIRQVSSRHPELETFLMRFYRERLLANLLATAPFLQVLGTVKRAELLAHFQLQRVDSGHRIVTQGERAGGFYLIVLGGVEITRRVSDDRVVLLATLGEGSYFGETGLLRGEVARASVTATGPSELALLPAKNFYGLVASNPALWDEVQRESQRRELETVQILAGTTGAV